MIGRPSARTSGQYDGDGMWMPCGSSRLAPASGSSASAPLGGSFTEPALVVLGVLAVPEVVAARRRRGISAKLYSGGGDGIDHSSVRASHGSCRRDLAARVR